MAVEIEWTIAAEMLTRGEVVFAKTPKPWGPGGGRTLRKPEDIYTIPKESILTDQRGTELIFLQRPKPATVAVPEVPAFAPDANLPPDAQAAQVLLHVLESGEPVPATAVQEAAKRYGIARRALRKAQLALSIRPKKTVTGWTWELPRNETRESLIHCKVAASEETGAG
jgi:hypothetical protein